MIMKYNINTRNDGIVAQTVDEVMTGFNRGDRVSMIERLSKYTGKTGTVVGYRENKYREGNLDLEIQFDCNEEGHYVYFQPSYFSKLPVETRAKTVQQERNEQVEKYAEWFATAYDSIHTAGGDPAHFLHNLGSQNIDSMVRNSLYITYKGKK